MIVLILSAMALAAFGGVFLFAWLKSKGVYDGYIETLDKKEYSFKDFIPLGLFLNERLPMSKFAPKRIYKYIFKYDAGVKAKVLELYGTRYADYHLMIHNGNKIAVGLVTATGAAAVAVIMGAQGSADNCAMLLFAAMACMIGLPLIADKGLTGKIEKRRMAMQMEFPDFINKLTLLVNAGMTISKAWEKIITENKKNTPLYNEMTYALSEIRAGKPEAIAYEEFARRCKVKEIIRFVSIVVLNLKKGGAEVVPVMRVQAAECWEMRKNTAKRLGEEASSKLLLPMAIMLFGIILIVVLPAILQMT